MSRDKSVIGLVLTAVFFTFVFILSPAPAHGDSDTLRCKGNLVQTGDSELRLLKVCGEPSMRKTETLPYRVGRTAAYKDVDKWYYNMGRNDFVYIVTIDAGKVTGIEMGERGY